MPDNPFGAAPIDGFNAVDVTAHLPEEIKVKSEDEKRSLLDGVLKAAQEKKEKGDVSGALGEVFKFAKNFLPIPN